MARKASAVVAAAVVVLGGGAAQADGKTDESMLGLLHGPTSSTLVRVDPHSLRALEGSRLDVGSDTYAWSYSRDRSRLALGGDRGGQYVPEVLFVDTRELRALGRVELAPRGWVVATAWLRDGRLRAVVTTEDVTVVTVDTARRKVEARRKLAGQLLHVTHARNSLVLLLAPVRTMGPARLAVVRPNGEIDVAVLRRVRAGTKGVANTTPALAVDPDGNRAFVVPARGEVAEIGLARLRVVYHALSQRNPQALAKRMDGPVRHARWLGSGLIAVSGGDYAVSGDRLTFTPAGVRIVDTRNWSARSLAPGADDFRFAGDALFAVSATWSSELELPKPIGVAAYGLDGRKWFHLYEGTRVWVVHANERRAFVDPSGPGAVEVVDVASGRIVERRESIPWPLAGDAASAMD